MEPSALNPAAPLSRTRNAIPWEPVALCDLSECLLEAYDAVACRATDLLRARGGAPGHELEDWRRAEAEALHRVRIDVQESNLAVTALVSIPGYSAREIALGVDPGWLVILGRHARSQSCIETTQSEKTFLAFHENDGHDAEPNSPGVCFRYGDFQAANSPGDFGSSDFHPTREVEPQSFGIQELPAEVDPSRCCAVLYDGLLGIRMLKAQPGCSPASVAD